jgi:serine/threonine protein phosphatase PrpC
VNTTTALRAASATHVGLRRDVNEDRVLADVGNGIFLVVDGMGGHAAGATAAETALKTIRNSLRNSRSDPTRAIRDAITQANNAILLAARMNPAWHGMSCVLTVAVVHEDLVTWGHVGDSRLYLFENGIIRKMTADHSPIGEQVDRGLLTEDEAMRHPRRHQVFRDVGSLWRPVDDPEFIQIESSAFLPGHALLLCSDGISDSLTSEEIASIVGCFEGNPENVANELVATAIERSGEDNVSAIFVAGPEFEGFRALSSAQAISRHAVTRLRQHRPRRSFLALRRFALFVGGIILGALLMIGWQQRANLVLEFSKLLTTHHFSSDRK